MTQESVLWIYIAFLVAGGLTGFFKARSKASIIASVAFAIPLALCASRVIPVPWVADIVLAVLIVFFGMRFAKSKKFMPSGMMAALSALALIGHLVFMRK